MNILDVFSTLTPDHPIHQSTGINYLLAPPPDADPESVTAFNQTYKDHPHAAGGLYPALLLDANHMVRSLADGWWCGLVLRREPNGASLNDALMSGLLAHPAAVDLPLVVDCGYAGFSHPEQLIPFMQRVPPGPIILTHGGQLNVSGLHLDAAEMIFKTYDYTLLETSGTYRQDFLERMAAELGYNRLLYGSGHPLMDERLEIERVRFLPVETEYKDAILGQNAARVFNIQH